MNWRNGLWFLLVLSTILCVWTCVLLMSDTGHRPDVTLRVKRLAARIMLTTFFVSVTIAFLLVIGVGQ